MLPNKMASLTLAALCASALAVLPSQAFGGAEDPPGETPAAVAPGELAPPEPVAPDDLAPTRPAPPTEPATPTPPAASDQVRRAPRSIKFDDLKLDPTHFISRVAPIDTAIVLNLKKAEREPERRWSLHFSFGGTQANLSRSVERARMMERFGREAFGSLQAGGLNFMWTADGPTEPDNGVRLQADIRYKLNSLMTLEARGGEANAITEFTQPGFRFDEKAEITDLSGGLLFTLPWRVWRFGFYAGGGGGLLHGKITSSFYVPSFDGTPSYLVSSATGNSSQYHVRGGGEMYLARFVSLTIEGEYRNAEIEKLKYTDTVPYPFTAKAVDETDTPLVWTYYEFNLQQQIFLWSATDPARPDVPTRPINIDFTGVSVTFGLRYHF